MKQTILGLALILGAVLTWNVLPSSADLSEDAYREALEVNELVSSGATCDDPQTTSNTKSCGDMCADNKACKRCCHNMLRPKHYDACRRYCDQQHPPASTGGMDVDGQSTVNLK